MPPIVTVTMNPTIDLSTSADRVVSTEKIRCAQPRMDPGGGGINVARTVLALGETVLAVLPAGGPTGDVLQGLLEDAGLPRRVVPIGGSTRESFAITENSSGRQFRFVLPGPTLTVPEWNDCLDAAVHAARSAHYVVASGSLPPGVPADFYRTLAERVAQLGCRFVLDTSGESHGHARDHRISGPDRARNRNRCRGQCLPRVRADRQCPVGAQGHHDELADSGGDQFTGCGHLAVTVG